MHTKKLAASASPGIFFSFTLALSSCTHLSWRLGSHAVSPSPPRLLVFTFSLRGVFLLCSSRKSEEFCSNLGGVQSRVALSDYTRSARAHTGLCAPASRHFSRPFGARRLAIQRRSATPGFPQAAQTALQTTRAAGKCSGAVPTDEAEMNASTTK